MNSEIEIAEIYYGKGEQYQQQQQQQIQPPPAKINVIVPEPDNTILWVSGVIVPVLLAVVGWYLHHRWQKNAPDWLDAMRKKKEK